jgi:hypothetical protein
MTGSAHPEGCVQTMVSRRDLRLDFFRGLALWFIFIDHVPSSAIGSLTFRNFGFSDATEVFVFISGYTAAIVYGASLRRNGFVYMLFQVLKRCWQLYAAHILLFVFFIAQITWVSIRFDNASFVEELNVMEFHDNPQQSIIRALILHYRPVNLDVLPLYMALLAGFPLCLWLLARSRFLTLLLSVILWACVQRFHWAVPVYEGGDTWLFNPLGWQLLFVIGAACGSVRDEDVRWLRWRPWLGWAAGIWLLFALIVAASWKYPPLNDWMERMVGPWLYPIDKSNFGVARLLHFLAAAYLVVRLVPEGAPALNWPLANPVIRCGQHSLYIFCVSISLSFVAHFFLVQVGRGIIMQLAVMVGGLVLMSALAYLLHWLARTGRGTPKPAHVSR